jgi:hypothetical protein
MRGIAQYPFLAAVGRLELIANVTSFVSRANTSIYIGSLPVARYVGPHDSLVRQLIKRSFCA